MRFPIIAATLISLVPSILALRIETPSNVQACRPSRFQWGDGTPPYYLSIIPGGQPSAPALKSFPPQNGTSLTWNVDLPPGTPCTLSLKDSTGTQAYSDIVTIASTSDSSCVNTSIEVSGTGSGSDSSAANTAPPNTAATGGAAATSAGSKTTTGVAPGKTNAAIKFAAGTFGLAGMVGLVGFALL